MRSKWPAARNPEEPQIPEVRTAGRAIPVQGPLSALMVELRMGLSFFDIFEF
jgi:hypothetical protein